jgi:branched-chain amino acid transport system substrate-binding protein
MDDQSNPAQAVVVTRDMLQSFHPGAIIGSDATSACYAMEPVTAAAKVVQYCLSGAPVYPKHPYYFSALGHTGRVLADVPATWFVNNKYMKVGFIGTTDASGQVYLHAYDLAVKGAKLTSVGQEFYSLSSTSVTAQLTRLRAAGAQALYLGTTGAGLVTAMVGLRQLAWNVPVFVGEGSVSSAAEKSVADLLPPGGLYGDGEATEVATQLPSNFPSQVAARAKDFNNIWVTELGNPPDWDSAAAYDTLNILLQTIANVGSNANKMVSYMTTHVFTGALFTYHFTSTDHRGSNYLGLVVKFTSDPQKPFTLAAFYPNMPRYAESG